MRLFFSRWLTTTVAVLAAAQLPGIHYENWVSLLLAALMLGIVNALIRPVILLLSLPLIVMTLGFFILIVNALVLRFVAVMVPGFYVDSFWNAFFGAIVISVVSWIVGSLFTETKVRAFRFSGSQSIPQQPGIKQANARVIDGED